MKSCDLTGDVTDKGMTDIVTNVTRHDIPDKTFHKP